MIYANWEERSARSNVEKEDIYASKQPIPLHCGDNIVLLRSPWIILWGIFKFLIRELAIFGISLRYCQSQDVRASGSQGDAGRVVCHPVLGGGGADSAEHCGFSDDGDGAAVIYLGQKAMSLVVALSRKQF